MSAVETYHHDVAAAIMISLSQFFSQTGYWRVIQDAAGVLSNVHINICSSSCHQVVFYFVHNLQYLLFFSPIQYHLYPFLSGFTPPHPPALLILYAWPMMQLVVAYIFSSLSPPSLPCRCFNPLHHCLSFLLSFTQCMQYLDLSIGQRENIKR